MELDAVEKPGVIFGVGAAKLGEGFARGSPQPFFARCARRLAANFRFRCQQERGGVCAIHHQFAVAAFDASAFSQAAKHSDKMHPVGSPGLFTLTVLDGFGFQQNLIGTGCGAFGVCLAREARGE